jgi:hypothetical protein
MPGLTKNEFKSTNINGVLSVSDYGSTTALFKCDTISPLTDSITITGPVYIPFATWAVLVNGYYDQFATGYSGFLDQFS